MTALGCAKQNLTNGDVVTSPSPSAFPRPSIRRGFSPTRINQSPSVAQAVRLGLPPNLDPSHRFPTLRRGRYVRLQGVPTTVSPLDAHTLLPVAQPCRLCAIAAPLGHRCQSNSAIPR